MEQAKQVLPGALSRWLLDKANDIDAAVKAVGGDDIELSMSDATDLAAKLREAGQRTQPRWAHVFNPITGGTEAVSVEGTDPVLRERSPTYNLLRAKVELAMSKLRAATDPSADASQCRGLAQQALGILGSDD